ncbi:hypothetical protein BX666DRAFT_893484 [Dichotomocladium elegans]|nr:hypothetical protein BX666DRAFT_893484 [Dichotomocladium elegans]
MRDMEARLGLPGLLLNKTCYMTRDTALREFETRMKAEAGTVRMSMRDAIRAMEAEDKAVQEQLRQRLEQIQEEAETRQYASLDQRLLETALRACEEASAAGCCAGTGIRGRVANAVDEALDAMMRRVEPVYRTLHTSKRLTTIEAGVKAVDEQLLRLLRKEPTEQQWTEAATLFHALEQVHRETEALKTAIAQLVEKNKALEAAYVSRRLRMLETRHQQLNTHMEQLQRSVLRPGFGERLDDLLSEYTQVMR